MRLVALAPALVATVIAACSPLAPRPDPSRFYVLTTSSSTASEPLARPVTVGLHPVRVPAYLDRPGIVTRLDGNRLEVSEQERWAEPLDDGVGRLLAGGLVASGVAGAVVPYPWRLSDPPDYVVEVELRRFEVTWTEAAELESRWSIRNGRGVLLLARDSELRQAVSSDDTEAAVSALSQTVEALGSEIAAAIRTLGEAEPQPAARRSK